MLICLVDMRKSYISNKRNKPQNAPLNKGTFYVHKREKSARQAEKNQHIIRASTILNASTIFRPNNLKSKR